jgi:hypothetical protein
MQRFCPDNRIPGFRRKGSVETPFFGSAKDAAGFQVLKHRLLLRSLDEIPEPECHANIIEEANKSAALACGTKWPHLMFPCLFEERARAAHENARQQSRDYWRCFDA